MAVGLGGCDFADGERPSIGRTARPRFGEPGLGPLKIGLVGTMSGVDSWRGEDAYEGADLAVHHLNRGLEEGRRQYQLEVLDDGGDGAQSLEHLRHLLDREDTVGILYAGPPEALADAESLLQRSEIPAVLAFGDLYGARQLRSHLFQASPPYAWQARDIARYLTRDRGYKDVGVLTEAGTHDGEVASGAAEGALKTYGIDNPVLVSYQADVVAALEQLRRRRVEALVVQGNPAALERIYEGLEDLGARYRSTVGARIASAPKKMRRKRRRSGWWHPQLAGFDLMIGDRIPAPPAGTVATATYARGAHYLPVPSFERFRKAFQTWWDVRPQGYEQRAYGATRALGWASKRTEKGDIAKILEDLRSKRLGGLPVTLGPDDHVTVEEVTIGLWTVPAPSDDVKERDRLPKELPWVPLARGFSMDGERTDILPADWKYLFRNPPPKGGPPPRFEKMRFGVTTNPSDRLR